MATTITILDQDRVDAENFLEQFLTDQFVALGKDADFRKGGALRDFAVVALSSIFAYLRREVDYVKARQSLLLLGTLAGVDVDRAVDEILSNWFLTRKDGTYTRGTVTIYLTDDSAFTVTTAMRFYRADGSVYKPDYLTDQAFGAGDMSPVTDSSGVVISYALRIPIVAVNTGAVSDVTPQAFTDYSPRSSRVMRVENENRLTTGDDTESTTDFLSRAETAVTTRNMASARSVDATIRDTFSSVENLVVIGYGDPEMIRDLVSDTGSAIRIHVGAAADAFLRSTILESQEFTGEIGSVFTDPRPGYYVFRDDNIDFVAAGIVTGDLIRMLNAIITEPQQYIIKEVFTDSLLVSRKTQFPLELPNVVSSFTLGEVGPTIGGFPGFPLGRTRLYAGTEYTFTAADVGRYVRIKNSAAGVWPFNNGVWEIIAINDAPGAGTNYATLSSITGAPVFVDENNIEWDLAERNVEYSVGNIPPAYGEKIGPSATGRFTRDYRRDGRILLPGVPFYKIRDVSFADPTNITGYAVGGRVTFKTRVNTAPANPLGDPDKLEYQVICANYEESQSGWQLMEIRVGWAGAEALFNGWDLRVTYDTLEEYTDVWTYMVDPEKRQVCAATIPRGLHPVYLSFTVQYKLVRTALESLDETEAAEALADFINAFSTTEEMDTSDFESFLRSTYDILGHVDVALVNYTLYAPDGRLINFQTDKIIELTAANETGVYPADRLDDLISQGVSINTVRYVVDPDDITFVQL